MAEISRLSEKLVFPPVNEGQEFIDWSYMREVVGILEEEIGKKTNTTVNLLLDQSGNPEYIYFGVPDIYGIYPDGTWRVYAAESGSYVIQYKSSGTWTTKSTLTSDGLLTSSGAGFQSVSVSSTYIIGDGIYSVLCDSSLGSYNVTLPSLTGQRSIRISVEGSGTVTAVGTINGVSNLDMYDGETWDFTDNLTEWRV